MASLGSKKAKCLPDILWNSVHFEQLALALASSLICIGWKEANKTELLVVVLPVMPAVPCRGIVQRAGWWYSSNKRGPDSTLSFPSQPITFCLLEMVAFSLLVFAQCPVCSSMCSVLYRLCIIDWLWLIDSLGAQIDVGGCFLMAVFCCLRGHQCFKYCPDAKV